MDADNRVHIIEFQSDSAHICCSFAVCLQSQQKKVSIIVDPAATGLLNDKGNKSPKTAQACLGMYRMYM